MRQFPAVVDAAQLGQHRAQRRVGLMVCAPELKPGQPGLLLSFDADHTALAGPARQRGRRAQAASRLRRSAPARRCSDRRPASQQRRHRWRPRARAPKHRAHGCGLAAPQRCAAGAQELRPLHRRLRTLGQQPRGAGLRQRHTSPVAPRAPGHRAVCVTELTLGVALARLCARVSTARRLNSKPRAMPMPARPLRRRPEVPLNPHGVTP